MDVTSVEEMCREDIPPESSLVTPSSLSEVGSSENNDNQTDSPFECVSEQESNNGRSNHGHVDSQEPPEPVQPVNTGSSEPIDLVRLKLKRNSQDEPLVSSSDDGLLSWLSPNALLARVAETAKNSVDTIITTIDPGMKEYLYSGGPSIVVTSDKESKVSAIRDAFIDVFGRATVKGVPAQSSSIPAQPVGPEQAVTAARERIFFIRSALQHDIPQNQIIVSIESFVTEICGQWYDIGCILLQDPLLKEDEEIILFTQTTPVSHECIQALESSAWSQTVGHFYSQKLNIPHDTWQEVIGGIPRRNLLTTTATSLAKVYKDRTKRKFSES